MKTLEEIGELHFGQWTILEICKDKRIKGTECMCQCSCGRIRRVALAKIRMGASTHCMNCSKRKCVGDIGGYYISGQYFSRIKHQAKNRNIEFDITQDFLYELLKKQDYKCFYSNLPLTIAKDCKDSEGTLSTDRIDSSVGYKDGNVVLCHKHINLMKNVYSVDEFLQRCFQISQFDQTFPALDRELKVNNHFNFGGYEEISGSYFRRLATSPDGRAKDVRFFIQIEDIWNQYASQGGLCALSGENIWFEPSVKLIGTQTASVDRIDSNKDYSVDNIQIVHKHVNIMKYTFSNDYFISLCKSVAAHQTTNI